MPYHGLIVYFELKRFARFETSTSVINTIITDQKSNFFIRRGSGFLQILLLLELFVSVWVAQLLVVLFYFENNALTHYVLWF